MSKHSRRGTRRKSPVSKHEFTSEWGSDEDELPEHPEPFDEELPGRVLSVPDRLWGFTAVARKEHPGACTACQPATMAATLVLGRDAAKSRLPQRVRYVVEPSRLNGLRKPTAFELVPRRRPLRRVRLLYRDRRLGILEADLFVELRQRLIRLFPSEK